MSLRFLCLILSAVFIAAVPATSAQDYASAPNLRADAEQILVLANQTRAQQSLGRVRWDEGLAAAALAHCRLMAREGPISHRYNGEPDLTARAAKAGAHFSLIEENVAIGPSASGVHNEWMNSPGHRENLLSPDIDSIGVAVISSRGVLYAVADYSRSVQNLSAAQVEQRVAALLRPSGVAILSDSTLARAACRSDEGMPHAAAGAAQPRFVMRWQDSDLSRLPQALTDHLKSGSFRQAAVASCPAQDAGGAFTAFRLAVVLY